LSKYVEFTEAEVFQANRASLEDFLRNHGETLIRSGTEWRWKRGEHDSITIRANNSYLSLGGLSGKALLHFLSVHPNIQEVTFCLDNDEKGRAAGERLRRVLTETGYETIKTGCYFPYEKDWNDQLKKERGLNKWAVIPLF